MFTVETQNLSYKLSNDHKEWLPKHITDKWDLWHEDRKETLEINRRVLEQVIPKPGKEAKLEQLPDLYEIYMGFKSSLNKEYFKNYESMFEVKGRTWMDNQSASIQKDALINNLEDFNYERSSYEESDEIIKNGEVTVFVHWDEKKIKRLKDKTKQEIEEEKRATIELAVMQGIMPTAELLDVDPVFVEEIVESSGANVKIIPADAFVYDINKVASWKNCPKIIRSFLTYSQVVNDETYAEQLTPAIKKEIKKLAESEGPTTINDEQYGERDKQRHYKGAIEVLEYWGDIVLKDGTVLNNWLVVVAGGKYLLRFEANPYLECPIVHGCYLAHAEQKRGISLLSVALVIAEVSDKILQAQLDALKFIINPCFIGPEGAIKPNAKNGKIKAVPGGYVGYDSEAMDKSPTPISFKDAVIGFQFLQVFERKIESGTGIYKNMTGDQSGPERTATEVVESSSGANVRLNDIVDFLNFTIKIPTIRNMALLLANFKKDTEEINTASSQYENYAQVDPMVRQGQYKYRISGSAETAYQRHIFKEALPVIAQLIGNERVLNALRLDQFVRWVFENLAVKDPDRLINFDALAMTNQVNQQGMPQQGMPQQGMPQQGMPQQGMPMGMDPRLIQGQAGGLINAA